MIIYKKDNSVRITIHQSDNSDVKYEISAEEYANVNIKSLDPIAFETGDYVTLFGQRFTLYKAASIIEKFSSEHFEYTLKFESLRADLASINFVLFDNTTDGTEQAWSAATTYEFSQKVKYNNVVYKYINPVPSAGHATSDADYWAVVRTAPIWDFPIVLDPKRYAQMVVDNINRARPNEAWTVGFAIDHTPMQATFSNTNCLDALGTISGIFETEFWIGNYTVNIGKRATTTSLTMQYGSDGGFRNITRTEVSNTKKVTRLVALGSDRNLQGTYRNGSPRLMLPTNYYIDSANIDANNPKEETVTWDDIYPCMEHAKEDYSSGTTYSLGAQVLYNRISWDYINATPSAGHTPSSGAYWKISEGTVLSAISTLKFSDENLTFNPLDSTYAMTDGTKPKVAFLTGNLAGYEFPISNFDPLTKTITLETIEDGTDNILPAKDYGFAYGDQYFFVDLYMPQSYITKAENRLLAKATEYLEKYSKDQISYRGDVSTIWATANSVNLAIGDLITVIDTDFGINDAYRIINLTRNITNPYKYSIELSQLPYIPSRIESIENSINDNQNQIDRNGSDKQMFKVHTYRGAKEAIDMAFDPEGDYFTDKIKPLIVETSQILIGTSSQQYALTGLVFSTLSSDPNTVSWTAGTITDSTMETSPRAWNIAAGTFVADADPLKSYYCYIVCPRAAGSVDATISFSEAQILVKQDNTNYYFLFGTLGKLIDGIRQLWTSKGFTFISGDTIVTGRIKNSDDTVNINLTDGKILFGNGENYLKYNENEDGKLDISGGIHIGQGSDGWNNIDGLQDEIDSAKDFATDLVDGIGIGGTNLLINSGFTGDYNPIDLISGTLLGSTTDLYGDQLKYWISTGNNAVIGEELSKSKFAVLLSGTISQSVNDFILSESYIIGFKAKGTGTLSIGIGTDIKTVTLSSTYQYFYLKYISASSVPKSVSFSGTATICEIKLERGTINTDWSYAPSDANKAEDRMKAIEYVTNSIKNGSTDIIGGLILSSMIQLGNYKDGVMQSVTSGISGMYNADDDPVFWGGGTFEDAIKSVMNPSDTNGANVVITHGGRAILNDAIIRGIIYASGGEFFGKVSTSNGGYRVELDPDGRYKLKVYDSIGRRCVAIGLENNTFGTIRFWGYDGETANVVANAHISTAGIIYNYTADSVTYNFSVQAGLTNKMEIIATLPLEVDAPVGTLCKDVNNFVKVKV